MKTRYMLAAGAALLLLAGCAKEQDTQAPLFSGGLRAVIESDQTRVSFDATGKFAWDEGDQIAVYVGSAFETVDIEAETGAFKVEGTGDRSFYAVYPATAAPADNSALTVTLPDSYDISAVTDADYAPVPMVAQNVQGQDELYFLHVGGLVRIFGKNLPAAATTAVVTFDKDVTGTYTVDTSNPSNPTITTRGNASNNAVTFTVGGKKDFVLNVPVPCGTYTNISVAIDGGTPVKLNESDLTFARHHGKTMMMGEVNFEYKLEGLHEVVAEYLGGTKELAQAFSSYKTDGEDKVGVPFVFEFSETGEDGTWSEDGAPDWLSVPDGVDYSGSTAGLPLSLSITPKENTAVDHHAEILKARTPKSNFDLSTLNVATGETVASSTANCYVVDAPGTYKFPLVYGNGLKNGQPNEDAWHARDGVGGEYRTEDWLLDSEFNEITEPYKSTRGLLAYMLDHRDQPVTSPYIATQLNRNDFRAVVLWTDIASNDLIVNPAVSGTGENTYVTFEVPAETIQQGNAGIAVVDGDDTVVWSWHIWVTDDDLKALPGPDPAYSFAPLNIGWRDSREINRYDERSWYIRVRQTEQGGVDSGPLKVTSNAGTIRIESGGRSMGYALGRKDPHGGTYFLTVGTSEPKGTSTKINIVEKVGETSVIYTQEYNDYVAEMKTYYEAHPELGEYPTDVTWAGAYSVGLSIRNPRAGFSGTRVSTWLPRVWHNLWNSSSSATTASNYTEVSSTKTIYDPCPVGYKVPTYPLLEAFNSANTVYTTIDGVPGRKLVDGDLFLPFIPSTSVKDLLGRYGTASFTGNINEALYDIYPEYIYGRTSEGLANRYPIRPCQE